MTSQKHKRTALNTLFQLFVVAGLVMTVSGCYWIQLVSVSSEGIQGTTDAGDYPQISGDGRYVAFSSRAGNLVPGDTNGHTDVFLYDTQTTATTRVSVDSVGNEANAPSWIRSISADGRYVFFDSSASNLVPNDTNGVSDAFMHNTQTGVTNRISTNSSGVEGNGTSGSASMADNGRYVTFGSSANNLVAGDNNGKGDIFVRDTKTGTITRVSIDSAGNEGNGHSGDSAISADGRYVAFGSEASNLVAGDSNFERDIFVHDRQTGTTARVNVDSAGNQANRYSRDLAMSADGRYIAFRSHASNLVAGDTNALLDVFVHDRQTATTSRISVDSAGLESDGAAGHIFFAGISISAEGRYVVFESVASNLVAGDTNGFSDIFIHDLQTGATSRLSLNAAGLEGNSYSNAPKISRDGRYVVFNSKSSNLVNNDTNGFEDIFIKAVPHPEIDSIIPDNLPIGATTSVTISGSGFLPDSALWFNRGTFDNVIIVDENTITADFKIPGTEVSGAYDFGVNIFGTGAGTATGASTKCEACITLF